MPDRQQETPTPTGSHASTSPALSHIESVKDDGSDSDVEAVRLQMRRSQGLTKPRPMVVSNAKGLMTPSIPESDPEPLEGRFDEDLVPDIQDLTAPRPKVGVHDLSQAAIRSRTQRIFRRRADGSKKVSEEVWADWFSKGKKKQVLEDIFKQVGYDPETCPLLQS